MKSAEDLGIEGVDEIETLDIEGSAIYRARQFRHNRIVAIKILDAHQEPLLPKRFDLRRKQYQKLAEDGGVVSLYQQGVTSAGEQYIMMPFFRIGSLADQLDHGPMPWHRAAELVMRTSEIVARAHSLGIVFGDLKPSSVMLADASSPMISMYGMATRRFDDGTPTYQAPETNRGSNPSPAADVYSLALTLASLISGRAPNRGPLSAEFLSEVEALAPARIVQVIEQGLSTRSADRHRSAGELAAALGTAIRGDQPSFGGNGHHLDEGAAPFDLDALLGSPAPPPPTGPTPIVPETVGPPANGHSENVVDLDSLLEHPITETAPSFDPPPPLLDVTTDEGGAHHQPEPPGQPETLDEPESLADTELPDKPELPDEPEPLDEAEPPDETELPDELEPLDEAELPDEPELLDEATQPDAEGDLGSEGGGQAGGELNGHTAGLNGGQPRNGDAAVIDLTEKTEQVDNQQTLVPAAGPTDGNGSAPNIEIIAATTGEFIPAPPQQLGESTDATAKITLGDATSQIVLADATQPIVLPRTPDVDGLQTESAPFEAHVPPPPSAADAIPPAVAELPIDQPPPPLLTDAQPADVIDLRTPALDEDLAADIAAFEAADTEIADYEIPLDQPPPPLLTDEAPPQAADGTSYDLDEMPPPPLPYGVGADLPLAVTDAVAEADGWPDDVPVTHAAAVTGTFSLEDFDQPPPPLVPPEEQVAAVAFGASTPDLGDEEIPFRTFERQHVDVAAPSPFLRLIDPLQIAWIQIRRSLGALLALIGFAVIAGIVGMVVLRGPQTATTGPNATFTTVQEEGSPSTFLPTSEAPIFVEPPVTHQTTTTRRIIRTTPSTAAPTTAAPTTAAPTTRAPTTRPATTRPATTRPATTRLATSRPASTRPPTTAGPPSSAATTLPPTSATVEPSTTRRRRTTTTEEEEDDDDINADDVLEGPTVPLIEDASVSRIRATTAQVQFSSSSCVTASFAYAATGESSTTVSGGTRCSRSYNLLLGTVTPRLRAGTTYTVTITATDTAGSVSTQQLSFTTLG